MPRYIHFMFTVICVTITLGLSACSTINSAYDSVANTVTGVFKSDDAKK